MSQYLTFKLVNKANPEIKVDLGYWCTSIARSIGWNFHGIFAGTGDNSVKLEIDTLKSYIATIHDGIEDYKKNLHEEQEKRRDNFDLYLKAQTEVVVNAIKEDIEYCDEAIADWKEEIDTWSSVESKLNYILEILSENSEEWELEYSNA